MVLRDLDLFRKYKDQVEIGLTITTLDQKAWKIFEKRADSPQKRVRTLEKLRNNEIKTYAFVGPILPFFTNLNEILANLSGKVDYILFDTLNTRGKTEKTKKKV